MGGDEDIHRGEGLTLFPNDGAEVRVGPCGVRVPARNRHTEKKLMDEFGKFCGFGLQREAEQEFGFSDGRNADLGHGNAAETLTNRRRMASQGVAHGVGIEHEAEHRLLRLEETASFGRTAVALAEEVRGDFDRIRQREEIVPGTGPARKNDVASLCILADEDFAGGKTEGRRQAYGLATSVLEEFCDVAHKGPPGNASIEGRWYIPRYITLGRVKMEAREKELN
jgi:hypothetical protein